MSAEQPLACRVTTTELCSAQDALLPGLVAHATRRTTLPHGMRFTFLPTAERLRQIASVAARENECCAFLSFRVGFGTEPGTLSLDVTGPEGTGQFLAALLDTRTAA